jgi:hypothetical protein
MRLPPLLLLCSANLTAQAFPLRQPSDSIIKYFRYRSRLRVCGERSWAIRAPVFSG